MVGLGHYLPYAAPVIVAHLGAVALMYLLLVCFGTSRWVAVVVSLSLAFFGAAAVNTLWDFQMGFVGAVFFGLLALWPYDRHAQLGWRISAVVRGIATCPHGLSDLVGSQRTVTFA
jgi:hypothetical protein